MPDATGTLALNGIKLDSKTAWTKPDTTVSHATAVVDSLSLDSDEGDPLTVDNWSVNLDSTQTGNFLDGALLYKFGRIKVGQSDLGRLEAGGNVAHVDMAALAALRSEERRVGKECVSKWRSRWSLDL